MRNDDGVIGTIRLTERLVVVRSAHDLSADPVPHRGTGHGHRHGTSA
jgi:hypothetical protein